MKSASEVIDQMQSDPEFNELPDQAQRELISGIEQLFFTIQTEYDECAGFIRAVFAKHDLMDFTDETLHKACAAWIDILEQFLQALVRAHITELEGGGEAFQESLMRIGVFTHILNDLMGVDEAEHSVNFQVAHPKDMG